MYVYVSFTYDRGGSWGNRTYNFTAEALPTGSQAGIGVNDTIRCNFTFRTNRMGHAFNASKAAIDRLFTFSSSLGSDYYGTWLDEYTLLITLLDMTGSDVTGGATRVGLLSMTTNTASGLAAWDGTTMPSQRETVLSGTWGATQGPQFTLCHASDAGNNDGFGNVSKGGVCIWHTRCCIRLYVCGMAYERSYNVIAAIQTHVCQSNAHTLTPPHAYLRCY